jgi:hypothetical protein
MSNKITGRDLEKLIEESLLNEVFPNDPQPLVRNKSGKKALNKPNNPWWVKNNMDAAEDFSKTDGNPNDFSKTDFDAAMKSGTADFKADLLNYYFELYMNDPTNLNEFKDALKNASQSSAVTQFDRVPFQKGQAPWTSMYHGGVGPERIMNKILAKVDPKNNISPSDWDTLSMLDPDPKLNYDDFKELMSMPEHPLHFPMLSFVERAFILSDKGEIGGKTVFRNLIDIAEEGKIDKKDLGLGRDKPIPQIDIHTRYAEKSGASTPETLQRIFDNAFSKPLTSIINLGDRISEIQELTSVSIDGDPIEKIMSKTIAYDYLRRIAMDYESSPAGFLFENFLALMVAGTKEGGNMRIEDFSFRTGSKGGAINAGSAKLYGPNATSFGGSCSLLVSTLGRASFTKDETANVHYFLARKGENLSNIQISSSKVSIYYVGKNYPSKVEDVPENADYWMISDGSGNSGYIYMKRDKYYFAGSSADDKTQWTLPWPDKTIGSLSFPIERLDKEAYNKELESYMDATKEKLGTMFKALNNFQVESTKYFSIMESGDKASQEKIDSFDSALEQLKSLRLAAFETFDVSGKSYKGIAAGKSDAATQKSKDVEAATKGALKESKITANFLKKLIKESFKK